MEEKTPPGDSQPGNSGRLSALTLGALGIVYGDIGTSPLYALRECFQPEHGIGVEAANVLGVVSLILWSILLVVTLKYLCFVMRADNRGEGGILALMALASGRASHSRPARLSWIVGLGLFGAALLYGDAIITPAISVLSAVEGLQIATPVFTPYLVPLTVIILTAVFFAQSRGTERIGNLFGPIMLVWFGVLAISGIFGIARMPSILGALTPLEGVRFLFTHSWNGFKVLGAVFLAVTGGEALYADMGHFGRKPIQHGWYFIVLPSLVLQYFGQGALLLSDPGAVENPFFHLVPTFALLPLVGLATIATVIASQAMLTGAFSLSHQAVQMGLLPPLVAVHTSPKERHQIYLPAVNWFLFIGTVCLVGVFQSSSRLAAAYGIAVTGTMVITTLLTFVVARRLWKWSRPLALAVTAFFLVPDLTFLAANSLKIAHGGWLPLLLGGVVFFVMTTWRHGRAIVHDRKATHSLSLERFLKESSFDVRARVPGVAIFLTEHPDLAPPALMRNVHHNHVLHEKVILLKVHTSEVPFVAAEEQITTEKLEGGFFRMKVDYGFMESINIPEALERSSLLKADEAKTYFFSSDNLVATDLPGMAIWREKLFIFLARNTRRASWLLGVPSEQVIQFGERVDL